jgi:mRNA interferase RelE/StbE
VYEILLERRAEKDLKKLPSVLFQRIIEKIQSLAENPKPQGSRKITGSKNDWRIRIGDYRAIYEIDKKEKRVKIMRIRHRREAYR